MSRDLPDPWHSTVRRSLCRGIWSLGSLLMCCLVAIPLASAQATAPEATVKAAFVFNFLRFTEWPARRFAANDAPLSLCVWSADARLSESLRALAGRTVDDRRVQVADIERADELGKCHALFVADAAARGPASAWQRRAESLDVLTMGDGDGFAASGGMIGLVSDGTRMRFEINDRAVKRSRLKLGPQLYQVGRSVVEGPSK
jgi:hypothetical protein